MSVFYNQLPADVREYVEEMSAGTLDFKCNKIIETHQINKTVDVTDLIALLTPTEQAILIRMWEIGWIPASAYDLAQELNFCMEAEKPVLPPTFKCQRADWMYEQRPSAVFLNVYPFNWSDVISPSRVRGNMNFVDPLWDTARQIGRAYAQLPFWTLQMDKGVVTLVHMSGKRFVRPSIQDGMPYVEESKDGVNWERHGMSAKPLHITQVVKGREGHTGVFTVEGDTYPYRKLLNDWGGEWKRISKVWMFVNPSDHLIMLLGQLEASHNEAGAKTWTKYHILAKLLNGGRATLISEDREEQERLFSLAEDAFYRETWRLSGYDYHDYDRAYQYWQESTGMPAVECLNA